MKNSFWLLGLLLFCVHTVHAQQQRSTNGRVATDPLQAKVTLHVVQQDIAIAETLQNLKKDAAHGLLAFRNVRVVDPVTESVSSNRTVIVADDRIVWVGDRKEEPAEAREATEIDGTGLYMSPGLADMHVHSFSAGAWLLDLANGVTTVREMAGFPWMLEARERIKAGLMLAPTVAVAGPLISGIPLEGYAVVIKDALDARRSVRQQAACGYDFIKVHNIVPMPIFDAVAEQAHVENMDLVGHVPQDISVQHAVQAGMRTMEHLKGFINDQTLKRGDTDYSVLEGKEVWNTPTLYAGRADAHGDEARSYMSSGDMQYVPIGKRAAWDKLLSTPAGPNQRLAIEARVLANDIVRELNLAHAHFLAGTDSDNYPFQVSGFALLDELRLMHDAGLSPGEVLRSATTEAARAMREPEEFGEIRADRRADFVLLDVNPLTDVGAFRQNRGVMVHGFWLDQKRLTAAMANLAKVYAERDEDAVFSRDTVHSVVERAESLNKSGFVLDPFELQALAKSIREGGDVNDADRLELLANIPRNGPCAERRPR